MVFSVTKPACRKSRAIVLSPTTYTHLYYLTGGVLGTEKPQTPKETLFGVAGVCGHFVSYEDFTRTKDPKTGQLLKIVNCARGYLLMNNQCLKSFGAL
ncbi:hypothetical protein GWI33_006355 [Rhynchophorus ferrugineus]|uniref:Uncharacterized protein n=1 Tax=Rhynchophorus ferrugineus TaxID=354439 RepID=A0A834MK97_RHYFE|nr:hypothetical protein GWI33_006355 [Rhynchophorus ferrugineus]